MTKIRTLLEVFFSGLLATSITLIVTHSSESLREKRSNSQNYILAFHGEGYMSHRDTLLAFAYDPAIGPEIARPRSKAKYAVWLISQMDDRPAIRVSISALAEFMGAARRCIVANACDRKSLSAGLSLYAASFYDVFAPVLVEMRCNGTGPDGTPPAEDPEDDVLFFAGTDPAQITCTDV